MRQKHFALGAGCGEPQVPPRRITPLPSDPPRGPYSSMASSKAGPYSSSTSIPPLGGGSCHAGEGRLVAVPLRDLLHMSIADGYTICSTATTLSLALLCAGIHRMVTWLSLTRLREQTSMAATAKRWSGRGRRSSLFLCGGGVDEDYVSGTALLLLVEGAEGLVYSEFLRVEDLFVDSEVVAASGRPLPGSPDPSGSQPSVALRSRQCPTTPLVGSLEGGCPPLD